MSPLTLFAFMFCAAGTALNVGLYINHPNPWSLGGAIFCGFLALWNLAAGLNA